MPFEQGPYVQIAAFCDEIIEDKTGTLSLIRVIDSLTHTEAGPDPPPQQEPWCTRSQIIVYHTVDGEPVALAHQYLRPDGTLGGTGKPDPKRLVVGDKIMFVRSMPSQPSGD